MMVDRRHAENPFAPKLERADLQDDRQRFDHKNPTNKKQKNLLLDHQRDDSQRSTQRQGANNAHEHFGGMSVVPEKAKRCADQRAAKYSELRHARDISNVQ